jgi:hypothetical protein
MNPDPFASVRINQPQRESSQAQPSQEMQSQESQDPFSSVRIKQSEEIPGIYEVGRHATRIASRIAETVGGIPGDVSSLLQSGLAYGLDKFTPLKYNEEAMQEAKRHSLPKSSDLKKLSIEKSKGFTEAQGEIEEAGDKIAETMASLLGPMKFRKALGVSVGTTAAKEGLKLAGVGELGQEAGGLGTMILLSALNPGGALKYASSQYKIANDLSKGASITAKTLENNLNHLLTDLHKGVTTPSKNAVIKPIEDVLNKVKNSKIPVQELTAAKRDLNTLIKDPAMLKREKKLLSTVGKEIDNAIKPYEKINPAFSKAYRPANEIYGAVMQGTKAYDFLRKNLGAKSILGALVGEAVLGGAEYVVPTLIGAVGAAGAAKTGDFFIRMAKSPELQKYYIQALGAAVREDVPALRIYAEKIEENLAKSKK